MQLLEKGAEAITSTVDAELLTPQEDLAQLVGVVDRHIRSSLLSKAEAGAALAEIRDRSLYLPDHKSFESFVLAQWDGDVQVKAVNRWIRASKVLQALRESFDNSPESVLPSAESQVEQLAHLPAEAIPGVWAGLLQSGQPITALAVNDAALKWLEESAPPTAAKTLAPASNTTKPQPTEPAEEVAELVEELEPEEEAEGDLIAESINKEIEPSASVSSSAAALSPSDFGPYLEDELRQFDRYLARYQGGVSFKQWVKAQIDEVLHDLDVGK
jgi:hypothetical protein